MCTNVTSNRDTIVCAITATNRDTIIYTDKYSITGSYKSAIQCTI